MILIRPSFKIEGIYGNDLLVMEAAGRTCYKSEPKGNPGKFISDKIKSKHNTIIEHSSMTVRFIVDRGFTHELVRHRMAVYSQESTRYCNYSGGVIFIIPPWVNIDEGEYVCKEGNWSTIECPIVEQNWFQSMYESELSYLFCLKKGWSPQQARTVLPNSLKTEIVMTANFREWRLVFEQRALGTTGKPHPQMLEIMIPLLEEAKKRVPVIFDDLILKEK
jgi:thymidylate synthase (FAD)